MAYIGRPGFLTGNVTPLANNSVSLGKPQRRWKELYIDANSLHLGNVSVSIGKTDEVEFMKTNKLGQPVTKATIANLVGDATITQAKLSSLSVGGAKMRANALSSGTIYTANLTGNAYVTRGLAVGYTDGRVPQANLDVKNNVYIGGATTLTGAVTTGSTLTLGSALAVGSGGTGATSLTDGGVLLGSGTSAVTAMSALGDGEMIVGDGTTDPVAESGATLRTSIGVGTGDSPQFTAVNIGAASDTTVARASAGDINVEGNIIYRAGGTDVPVSDGGTGASSLTDGGVLLGSGTGAITAMSALGDSEMIVGDGSTDPVAESGDTLRTSIGIGSAASGTVTQIYSANTTGNVKFARGIAVGYAGSKVPGANLDVKGNAYIGANVYVANTQNFNSTNYSGLPYDIAFTAGFDADMVKEDVAAATYGELVMARPATVVGEAGYVDTAPTGAALIVDIEKNGTSIYATRPQFAASATSLSAGTLGATAVFVSGDRISFKIDQIGSSEPGEGVRFTLKCKV
jgi:hypothetical protein